MLEFMLRQQLAGKPEDEVFSVIHGIFATIGNVLYPLGVEVTPMEAAAVVDDNQLSMENLPTGGYPVAETPGEVTEIEDDEEPVTDEEDEDGEDVPAEDAQAWP